MPTIEFKIQWTEAKNKNAILRGNAAEIEITWDVIALITRSFASSDLLFSSALL